NPARAWMIPARITVAKIYSTPWLLARATITTATAPVAPDIIPGLPPKMDVTKPMTKAAYNTTNGDRPPIKAKAMASGTKAMATVSPERISVLYSTFCEKSNNRKYCFMTMDMGLARRGFLSLLIKRRKIGIWDIPLKDTGTSGCQGGV